MNRTELIHHYTQTLRWGLVHLENGKRPIANGWPDNPLTQPEVVPTGNIGLNHGYSKTAALDIDHPGAAAALAAVGVDLEAILAAAPYKIVGDPENPPKPIFRLPAGIEVKTQQCRWPDPTGKLNDNGQPALIAIFELRGGRGFQDVLPPSIHPDTKKPYAWVDDKIPPDAEALPILPQELLKLWLSWDLLKSKIDAACPWLQPVDATPARQDGQEFDVEIVQREFNQRYRPGDILERNGYPKHGAKWLCPNSSSKIPGVISLGDGEKIMSFHGSDVLSDGKPHDAYDCFVLLEHAGDRAKAWRAGVELLGINFQRNGHHPALNGNGHKPATNGAGPNPGPVEVKTQNYLIDQDANDEGNAQCLLRMFPGRFLYCPEFGQSGWLFFNGKFWQTEHAEEILDRHIVEMIQARHKAAVDAGVTADGKWLREAHIKFCVPNNYRVRECKKNYRSLVRASISEFDADPDVLNCKNGVVDLKNGQLAAHEAGQRFTYALQVDYDPQADYSAWVDWLTETVGGNAEVAEYLQQTVGYSLTGRTFEECLFYVHGPTRSGKGTFTETLLKLLPPPLSTGVDFATFTAKRDHDSQNFDLAGLKAARLIVASESNKYQILNPRRIKAVTGGDAIRCAHKHGSFFSYFPQFKIWLVSNEPLRADAEDDAIWARVNVITFPNSHLGKEDKNLKRQFLSESNLKAVLAWAIEGSMAWYRLLPTGLQRPAAIQAETQKHRNENDFSGLFVEECTERADGHFLPNPVLKAVYSRWCEEHSLTPKFGLLTSKMDALDFFRHKGYYQYSDLQLYGYDRAVKPWGQGSRQFRGYYGVMIPQAVCDEYL